MTNAVEKVFIEQWRGEKKKTEQTYFEIGKTFSVSQEFQDAGKMAQMTKTK